MDRVVALDLTSWHGLRTRDPRRLALGTVQWGTPYGVANRSGPPADDELDAILRRAWSAGIRTLDTARAYGESEARLGPRLADRSCTDGWRVITKLDPGVYTEGQGLEESLARIAESLAASREALGQAVLPAFLLHRFAHRHACAGKLWRSLLAEREAGRIGALGVSATTPEEAWAALEDPDIEILQVASSLLDLRLFRQGFFPRARELGRTVYVRSVFLQGVAHLEPDNLPAPLSSLVEPLHRIHATADQLGVPPRALFLGFAREYLPGAHLVIGCEREAQLAELLEDWFDERVDGAHLSRLVEALPTLEAESVDPSRWPRLRPPEEPENQTPRGSVATIRP